CVFFFSSRRRHTRFSRDWSSDVSLPILGYVHGPEDLLVDEHGRPRRIDHAFSWAYPLSAHGMMHTLIRNAHAGDPYRIDTLLMRSEERRVGKECRARRAADQAKETTRKE